MSPTTKQGVSPPSHPFDDTIKVLVIVDHFTLGASLEMFLESDVTLNIEVTTRGRNMSSVNNYYPDVIILMVDRYADLELIPTLQAAAPYARILALICSNDRYLKLNAMKFGVAGVLIDTDDPRMLFAAVKALHSGNTFVSPTLSHSLFSQYHGAEEMPVEKLTSREYQIVQCVCAGLVNKQVAVRLHMSEPTVKHHLRTIFSKLRVGNRAALVAYAYKRGIVAPGDQVT